MTDSLSLFDDDHPESPVSRVSETQMTDVQREGIRAAFARLGTTSAHEQFEIIERLTGRQITSVQQMTKQSAAALLPLLAAQERSQPTSSGNAWADRTEDTWIDKL